MMRVFAVKKRVIQQWAICAAVCMVSGLALAGPVLQQNVQKDSATVSSTSGQMNGMVDTKGIKGKEYRFASLRQHRHGGKAGQ